MRKKRIMILDIETTIKEQVFDVGVLIGDLHGNITERKQWILREGFAQKLFWEKKRIEYLEILADRNNTITDFVFSNEMLAELGEMIKKYRIKEVYAYNAMFDTRHLAKLAEKLEVENPLATTENECLWTWACQTLFQQKKFQKWALDNPKIALTEKGNFKTSAEIAYAYITNNPQFEEVHRSIEDTEIEYEIFLKLRNLKQIRFKGLSHNPWLLVQTEKNIKKLSKGFRTLGVEKQHREQAQKVLNRLDKPISLPQGA